MVPPACVQPEFIAAGSGALLLPLLLFPSLFLPVTDQTGSYTKNHAHTFTPPESRRTSLTMVATSPDRCNGRG